jgi:hypothetical protein
MRQLSVSTEVFAAIWAARKPGEETEDDILKRILLAERLSAPSSEEPPAGHIDLRSGTKFPTGFEIFRTYKGTEYRARAIGGVWILSDTGRAYRTLNQLSQGIGIQSENAWRSWYFQDAQGKRSLIDTIRQ